MNDSVRLRSINPDQIVNFIITDRMSYFTGSELKVYLLIYHVTFGRCAQEVQISLDQFVKYTGLARNTVIRSINSLVDQGHILKFTETRIYTYALNTVAIFGPGGSEIPVQKYVITHKETPRQEFSGVDRVVKGIK